MVLLALGLVTPLTAQPTPQSHQVRARLRTLPVTIDGKLGEWRQVDFNAHSIIFTIMVAILFETLG